MSVNNNNSQKLCICTVLDDKQSPLVVKISWSVLGRLYTVHAGRLCTSYTCLCLLLPSFVYCCLCSFCCPLSVLGLGGVVCVVSFALWPPPADACPPACCCCVQALYAILSGVSGLFLWCSIFLCLLVIVSLVWGLLPSSFPFLVAAFPGGFPAVLGGGVPCFSVSLLRAPFSSVLSGAGGVPVVCLSRPVVVRLLC